MLARSFAVGSLGVFAVSLHAQSPATLNAADGRDEFTQWAAHAAQRLPDSDSRKALDRGADWIGRLTGNARVVGIGESAHDMHDFLALRTLVTRRLIEQGRVAAIVMETSFADAIAIDSWLAGRSAASPDLDRSLSYGFGPESELLETFQWIRSYNSTRAPNRQVHFYGADLPSDGGGSFAPALTPVWTYLSAVDPGYAVSAKSRIAPIEARLDARGYEIVQKYAELSPPTRDTLHRALDELAARMVERKQEYIARSTRARFIWTQRLVEIARQTEEAVRLGWNDPSNPRDGSMAANIQWIAEGEKGRGLVVVRAHNLHISRDSIGGPIFAARGPPVASMGHYLQADFGARYVAIGTTFRAGGPDTAAVPDTLSIDGALSRVQVARFGVEIRKAPTTGPVAAWLNRSHLMRAEDGYVTLRPRSAFDAILFLDRIGPSIHTGG